MRKIVAAIAICGPLAWSSMANAGEAWDCHIGRDTGQPASVDRDEAIIVNGAEAILLRDPAMTFVVDRNDDEKLIASFADYGGKPPIRTVITVVKASGEYSQVVIEADRTLGSATGHCTRQ